MRFRQINNDLLLSEINNFDPFVSCECGQCFRFEQISESEYRLFACGRELVIDKTEEGWLFLNIDEAEFKKGFFDYFDLGRDYGEIISSFSFDKTISLAAQTGSGIRIFRQDPFETLISFIISQNNNIPRIKKIIEALCRLLGEEKNGFYSFPTAEKIAEAGIEGLAPIKSGFRAKYIIDAASKVASGEISIEGIQKMSYAEALAELKKIKGVGDKVANCVLLFGFGHYGAFPIDVWVKRVIDKYYNGSFDPQTLGEYAGIAQQYLFYHERSLGD
ncbi:MAG: DNA-3-methyladenine glycosylase 2 family protein [Clostridia bacterium]|nr:DNA-3-methyladenine glycosylase 2 family protein [Clostridia bacterium]